METFSIFGNYDAETEKRSTLSQLKKAMEANEEISLAFLSNYFTSLQLAEIVDSFFDTIRPNMDNDAIVFGLPIKADALDIAAILRKPELVEIVANIVLLIKQKQADGQRKELAA